MDPEKKLIVLKKATAGRAPRFDGDAPFGIHAKVREKMRSLYNGVPLGQYLDQEARSLFDEGKKEYAAAKLDVVPYVDLGSDTDIFLWTSDFAGLTVALLLSMVGLKVAGDGLCLTVTGGSVTDVKAGLAELVQKEAQFVPLDLARQLQNKQRDKYDYLLTEEL